jgi:hypothetical protein
MEVSPNVDAANGNETNPLPISLQTHRDEVVDAQRWLSVSVPAPGPAVRGRLALFIEGAIERTLEAKSAPPPGIGASANLAESLDDQLTRTRLSGALGLVLRFASLRGVTDSEGAFDTDDSGVLRWLLRAPRDRALRLHFEPTDGDLRVFDRPVRLDTLVDDGEGRARLDSEAPPAASPGLNDSVVAMRLTPEAAAQEATPDSADDEEGANDDVVVEPSEEDLALAHSARLTDELLADMERTAKQHEEDLRESARALAEEISDAGWLHETLVHLSTPPPTSGVTERPVAAEMADTSTLADEHPELELTPASIDDFVAAFDEAREEDASSLESGAYARVPTAAAAEHEDDAAPSDAHPRDADDAPATTEGDAQAPRDERQDAAPETADDDAEVDSPSNDTEPDDAAPSSMDDHATVDPEIVAAEENEAESTPEAPAPDPELLARCEAWQRELAATQGPKPLSVVERQFTSAYVPLREAVDRGLAGAEARSTLDEWATSFAKSYTDAFEVLRYRGKRPSMVLDLPDLAVRIARLHGARTTQLLLVDGMRFDVGLQVDERLRRLVGGRAACAERLLLWSALPSTTATQLELIGRGPMGLRDLSGVGEEDLLVARGRKASTLRRLRTGQRELLKLDIVEARMADPGGPAHDRILDAADEVAERLAAHFEGVPDRTLVVVFGDHGFVLDPRDGGGTMGARQGGASPEEVLVPAFAWVVGAVH